MPGWPSWMAATAAAAIACGGGGGGGGGGDGGGGGGGVQALNLNEGNVAYAAGVAARVFDLFRPISDLLMGSFDVLSTGGLKVASAGAVNPGEEVAIEGCTLGGATLTWSDPDGSGALSAGDRMVIGLSACRAHASDAETIDGSLLLAVSSLTEGPRTLSGSLQVELSLTGPAAGALGGAVQLSAREGAVGWELGFQPSGESLLTGTGAAAFDLACFDAVDYPSAPSRRVAVMGAVRTLGKVMGLAPGSRLEYRGDDLPVEGRVDLLSFLSEPSCPALGTSGGVSGSDGSTAAFLPGVDGMQVELHRSGLDPYAATLSWYDLLHPEVPDGGVP